MIKGKNTCKSVISVKCHKWRDYVTESDDNLTNSDDNVTNSDDNMTINDDNVTINDNNMTIRVDYSSYFHLFNNDLVI